MAIGGDALEIVDSKFKDLTIGNAPLEVLYLMTTYVSATGLQRP